MSFIHRRVVRNNALIFLLVALLAWPVIGQESVLEQLLPDAPLFSIVAPLPADTVSGDVVFIIKPLSSIQSSSIRLLSSSADFESSFSSDDSYMATWSSLSVPDGEYDFSIEACDDARCDTQKLSVRVKNAPDVLPPPADDVVSIPSSDAPNGVLTDDVSSSDDSSRDTESSPRVAEVVVTPSNFFGAFTLRRDALTLRSSGDDWSVLPDSYSVKASFLSENLDISVSSLSIDSPNVIFFLEKNIIDSFVVREKEYSVSSSLAITIPYSFDAASFDWAGDRDLLSAACLNWVSDTQSCASDWIISPTPSFVSDFSSSPIVLALVSPASTPASEVPLDENASLPPAVVPPVSVPPVLPPASDPSVIPPVSTDPAPVDPVPVPPLSDPSTPVLPLPPVVSPVDPLPPLVEPPIVIGPIPAPVEQFLILPSNLPSTLSIFPLASDVPITSQYSALLPAGEYHFDVSLVSGDLNVISLRSVSVDKNATLVELGRVPAPFSFDYDGQTLSSTRGWSVHFSLIPSSVNFSFAASPAASIFVCSSWASDSQSCATTWSLLSSTSHSSDSPSSDWAFVLVRSSALPGSDVNNSSSPAGSTVEGADPRLVNAIWSLKNTHLNKQYFFSENARSSYAPLSTLFSSIEIALECDPSRRTIPSPPSLTPVVDEVTPLPPSTSIDELPALPDVLPPVSPSDENVSTLSNTPHSSLLLQETDDSPQPASADSNDLLPLTDVPLSNVLPPLPADVSPAPIPPVSPPNPYFDPRSPLFYTDDWEDTLVVPALARQAEDVLSCDGVSLTNVFEDRSSPPAKSNEVILGSSLAQVKQSLYVTNTTSSPQTRNIIVRASSPHLRLDTDAGALRPSSTYDVIPSRGETNTYFDNSTDTPLAYDVTTSFNSTLHFRNIDGSLVGKYDFSDLIRANYLPDVVVHSRNQESIIETIIPVTVLPGETLFLDPIYDLNNDVNGNYAASWYGLNQDNVPRTSQLLTFNAKDIRTPGVQFFDLDQNGYANDAIITSSYADVNGKANVGAVWMILDVDTVSGLRDLNQTSMFTARWNGRTTTDSIGHSGGADNLVQIVDLDGNGWANDMLIGGGLIDYNGTDKGCVMLIKDIHMKRGFLDTNFIPRSIGAMWCGFTASDNLTNTLLSGSGMQVVNIDGNAVANDLILSAANYDRNAAITNVGGIFIIKDANTYTGITTLSWFGSPRYTAIIGAKAADALGSIATSSNGWYLANLDDNSYANDLIIGSSLQDTSSIANNAGAVYMLLDVDTKIGLIDFNTPSAYNAKWYGHITTDSLGGGAGIYSGDGVYLINADGNTGQSGSLKNDMVIQCPLCDAGGTNRGAIYYINDINQRSGDLNLSGSFNIRWVGAANTDEIGFTNGSGNGVLLADIDGNGVTNDMILQSTLHNYTLSDSGAVYLIRDFNRLSGAITLNTTTTNFSVAWAGQVASDFLGDVNFSGNEGLYLVNLDGNALANDLIFGASRANGPGLDNGCVYMVLDINTLVGSRPFSTASNYNARWCGGRPFDRLGETRNSGSGIQVVNIDNNANANDLLLTSIMADVNATGGRYDNGVVYLIKDIVTKTGNDDLNVMANYNLAWYGDSNTARLGDTNRSGSGVRVVNLDNNAYANDLLIAAVFSDFNALNTGSLYVIQNIDTIPDGNFDLNQEDGSIIEFRGAKIGDELSSAPDANSGFGVLDADNNGYTNDLWVAAPFMDANGRFDPGQVFLIKDVVRASVTATISPDINVWKIDGWRDDGPFPLFNYYLDGNLTLDFNVFDSDTNSLLLDINYSASASPNTGTSIVDDVNLSQLSPTGSWNCSDTDFADMTTCSIDWNTSSVADGNYFIHMTLTDSSGNVDQNTSDRNVGIANSLGSLSLGINIPSADNNSYSLSTPFEINATVSCILFRCGPIDTNIQYCTGAGCSDFYDMNTVDGSPLEIIYGTNPDTGDLNSLQVYNVDWWVMPNVIGTYELRLRSKGSATNVTTTVGTDRTITVSTSLVPPDVNVWRFDRNPDNGDFKVFNYYVDGNLSLDFNVFDSDTNSLLLDINYSTSAAPYTGTVIYDDLNLSTFPFGSANAGGLNCGDTDFTNVTRCTIDWNILSVADGNYFIHATLRDSSGLIDQNTSDRNVGIFNRASPDVNIIKIDGFLDTAPVKLFDYFVDGNLTIDFNVQDLDTNGLLIDINYSSSSTPRTGTAIVDDVNIATLFSTGAWYCQDTDFRDITTCGIDWNISSVPDGNYFIHITATDESLNTDQNTSDTNVGIANVGPRDDNGFLTVYSVSRSEDFVVSDIDVNTTILTIPAGRFIADHNYLIFTSALLTGSANTVQVHSAVTHGGVSFPTVEETQEIPAAADSTFNYSSVVLWQAVSGESVSYEVTGLVAATSVTVRNVSMIILDLNKLTRNADWFYDLNQTDIVNASSTFASNPGASITFTPDGISDYLFLGTGQMLIDGTLTNFAQMELHDGTSQLALAQRDFEDASDQSVLSVMEVVDNPPATPSTYTLRFSGNSQHDLNSSTLFVLRMDALATHDSNIVDENFLITPTLATRADLNIPLGKDGNVVAFYAAAARHERGTVGNTQYDYQAHFDDVNYFSADGNFMRSWSTSVETYGGDLSFNLTGLDLDVPDDLNHKYSTKLISETTDPSVDAHAERKAGVVVFTHRLSGDLNILWDYPSTDGPSYGTGVTFSASGRTLCEDYNCGLVGTRLQYCTNASCTDFYDINSVVGSPLELVSGSIPDTNSDLNAGTWYDANWTLKGNVAGTYELRLYASGTTSETSFTPSGQRTVIISGADYTFVLSLPSSGCTNGKGNITGGTSCQRGWLESSDTTGASDANQIAPEGQTSSIPFFRYDNQSSTSSDLNIILDLNEALSSQLRLKASSVSSGYQGACSGNPTIGCILLTTSTQNVGKAPYSTGSQDLNVWFWADFVAAIIQQTDINVDSNSVSSV